MFNQIDRTKRQSLATLIRQYLDEQHTAFEFDELLDDYRDSSDEAIRFVVEQVWHFYDDCDDHLVALDKPTWDYHQRLLLLLESDLSVETTKTRHWSWTQIVAALALAGFATAAFQFGWGSQLLIVSIPFGLVSIAISALRHNPTKEGPFHPILYPFDSFANLKEAYVKTTSFKKDRYPREIQTRKIRSPIMDGLNRFLMYISWLLYSPFRLFCQLLPQTTSQVHLREVSRPTNAT